MFKRTLFLIAMATPAFSYGAVYQCKVNGQTVFSDEPCGDDAKKIQVEAPNSINMKVPEPEKKKPMTSELKHLINGIQAIRERTRNDL